MNFGHGQIPNRGGALRQFSAPNMRPPPLDRVPENDWVEESYYYDEYMSEDDADDYSQKSVPIWLSLCLVIAYIVWGAFIFQVGWKFML